MPYCIIQRKPRDSFTPATSDTDALARVVSCDYTIQYFCVKVSFGLISFCVCSICLVVSVSFVIKKGEKFD